MGLAEKKKLGMNLESSTTIFSTSSVPSSTVGGCCTPIFTDLDMANLSHYGGIIAAGIVGVLGGIYVGKQISNSQIEEVTKHIVGYQKKIDLIDKEGRYDDEEDGDDDDDEEDEEDVGIIVNSRGLNAVEGEVRMALIVRTDLGMLKGKVAAQCSHAAVSLYKQMISDPESDGYNPEMIKRWEQGGQAKIVLKSSNIDEIDELLMRAVSLNINNYLVVDAGRTQIASGSATVLGLGPAPRSVLALVTGDLKLY